MNSLLMIAAAVVSLNGDWQLKGWPTPDGGGVRTLTDVPSAAIDIPAKVPGCYELDLCAAGLLPDLLYANNQYAVRKYEGHQWLYAREFVLGEISHGEKAVLAFDGLDTLCDVFVNGRNAGEAADMFIPHEFDVTRYVRIGTNEVAVLFRAPAVESQFAEIAAIGNAGTTSELETIRKPAHMIGWDILPRFMSAGIFRDVRLEVRRPERIRDHFCALLDLDHEKLSARYLLDLRLEGPFRRLDTSEIALTVSRNGHVVETKCIPVVHWTPRMWFSIDNADLWWPLGFGEAALYDAKVEWRDCATRETLAAKDFRIGVKKVELELSDHDVPSKTPGEMKFIVNGKPCFIRGTSWTPVDALHCRDRDRIVPTLELVRDANCNMIRVWGGGLYEPEMFWNWCDENGVMVWQDFCFACTQYPQGGEFLEHVRRETVDVVKRLRNHASLALWCGNNENDHVFRLGPWRSCGADPDKDVISRRLLPEILREFDPTHPYLPSSPYINESVMSGRALSVEGHYYRRWWKGELLTSSHEKFYSEFGCHGCPAPESIREMFSPDCHEPFVSPKEKNVIWPVKYVPYTPGDYSSNELVPGEPPSGVFEFNDQWTKRGVCVFENRLDRSKFVACRNHRMILQMHMLFGDVETDLDGFALESQCAQAEGMKFFIEHCRSRKFAEKTGMTWWNIRDGWPVISDSVVDYYGRRKLAYEYIKRAQQDVLVMVDENGDLLVVNDLLRAVGGHAVLTDSETGRVVFDGDFSCAANSVARFGRIRLAGQGVVKIAYTADGRGFSSHYLYGGPSQKFVGEKKIRFADYCKWMNLRGKWISGGSKMPESPAPVLERRFVLDELPRCAVLNLAVAGWHEVRVNGMRTDADVLSPVTCQPDRRISSVVRDVAQYLKKGENTVSVLLGNGWFNCFTKETWGFSDAKWLAEPMVRGDMKVNGETLFVTDDRWMAYDSPIVFNALRNGEWYDARRESRRENERLATVVAALPSVAISPEDAAPCRAYDPTPPVRSFAAADGGTIYDFGSNRTGWCEIEVVGEAGAKVAIDYDESLSASNTLLGAVGVFIRQAKDPRPFQHDEYTLAGHAGGEKWHPSFTYHGFRYARVRTQGSVELKSIKSVFVHSAFDSAGSVEVSDSVFAKLQDAACRSYLSNFSGIPTDCPHREKNGWTGDAQLAMETGLWNFDAKAGYVHFLRMMLDAQKPDGRVPCILPCTEKFGYGWGSGPAWDAALFEIPWQVYRFYGADALAREAYGAMKRYLAFIDGEAREDGLVEYGLGDWCAPEGAAKAPTRLTDSAYIYEFNRRTAFWAERFGEPAVAAACRERADGIKAAFNREFYKGNGVYAGGEPTSLAAPLYFKGLCADGEEGKVADELLRRVRENGHKALFGILGAKWVPRALSEHGHVDDAWRLFTQPERPGWAAWVADGEDTLRESFDANPWATSRNHIMFGDLSAWAYEYMAGIKIDKPGFAEAHAEPHLPEGVASFDIVHRSPRGPIRVRAWRENGRSRFDVAFSD